MIEVPGNAPAVLQTLQVMVQRHQAEIMAVHETVVAYMRQIGLDASKNYQFMAVDDVIYAAEVLAEEPLMSSNGRKPD